MWPMWIWMLLALLHEEAKKESSEGRTKAVKEWTKKCHTKYDLYKKWAKKSNFYMFQREEIKCQQKHVLLLFWDLSLFYLMTKTFNCKCCLNCQVNKIVMNSGAQLSSCKRYSNSSKNSKLSKSLIFEIVKI